MDSQLEHSCTENLESIALKLYVRRYMVLFLAPMARMSTYPAHRVYFAFAVAHDLPTFGLSSSLNIYDVSPQDPNGASMHKKIPVLPNMPILLSFSFLKVINS